MKEFKYSHRYMNLRRRPCRHRAGSARSGQHLAISLHGAPSPGPPSRSCWAPAGGARFSDSAPTSASANVIGPLRRRPAGPKGGGAVDSRGPTGPGFSCGGPSHRRAPTALTPEAYAGVTPRQHRDRKLCFKRKKISNDLLGCRLAAYRTPGARPPYRGALRPADGRGPALPPPDRTSGIAWPCRARRAAVAMGCHLATPSQVTRAGEPEKGPQRPNAGRRGCTPGRPSPRVPVSRIPKLCGEGGGQPVPMWGPVL